MPDRRPPRLMRSQFFGLLLFYVLSIFLLALAWEFKLESLAMSALGLPYDTDFETAERWRFVFTSTAFALVAMVVPFTLLLRLLQRLALSYSDLLAAQAQTERLARYDSLSGLLNRRVFHEQLAARLEQRASHTAVFLIDLDRFKSINDTQGHAAGDSAICTVAQALRDASEGWEASIARLGGDEFALAFTGTFDRTQLAAMGERVLSQIAAASAASGGAPTTATLGIALSPDDGQAVGTLLQHADSAMYQGKQSGRGTVNFFEPRLEQERLAQRLFEGELRRAIEAGQIQPYYQPIVSLPGQGLVGFELLARWVHPQHGVILPQAFISVAERLNLIQPLTEGLLAQAFGQARHWPAHCTLAVNVTSCMIESPGFIPWLEGLARAGGFALHRLEVEVTENTLVANVGSARSNLQRLQRLGVCVALDDFGTGYSGLYHLTQLAIDKIKIDRSFFEAALAEQGDMVKAILALGKSLGMKITAEGVEDPRLAEWLTEHQCDFAQGYLFGRPLSFDQVMAAMAMGRFTGLVRAGEGPTGCAGALPPATAAALP